MVWIRTNTRKTTREFLSLVGVQSAVSELIGMKSVIDIDEAKVYVKAESSGTMIPKDFVLNAAILGHYLSVFVNMNK
ncbi:MAG: hypothetical protein JXR76_04280 [Deltaproteobacteria bacterium]|nr:hypothetical protein [Deltaproteobacteria bacterium]